LHDNAGEPRKALELYEQALALAKASGDKRIGAQILVSIGGVYKSLGEMPKALDNYNQALPQQRAIGDRRGEGQTLNNIGAVYDSMGEPRKALEQYKQSLAFRQSTSDRRGEAQTLVNIGGIYDLLGDKQAALEHYNQALAIQRAVSDPSGEALTMVSLGTVYNLFGQPQNALEYFERALKIQQKIDDRRGEVTTLNNIASAYDGLGEPQKALEFYNRALDVSRAVLDRRGEATSLNRIGGLHFTLNEPQKALEYFKQALALKQAVGDRAGEASTLHSISYSLKSLGKPSEALDFANQALSLRRAVGDRDGEASDLTNLAGLYYSAGEKQKAMEFYGQALPLMRATGNSRGEAVILNNFGFYQLSLGENQKALDFFNQAVSILHATGFRRGEAIALSNVGRAYESMGQSEQALDFYRKSIQTYEGVRTSATLEEIKTGLAENSAAVYQRAILLLMRLGQTTAAFEQSESARARTLLDQLGNVRVNVHKGIDNQLSEQEQLLRQALNNLDSNLRTERSRPQPQLNPILIQALEGQLRAKQREYEDLLTRIKLQHPAYASLLAVSPVTLPQAQKLLDAETTLLSYFVTPQKTIAFIITRDSFEAVELPVSERELGAATESFRGFADKSVTHPQSLQRLYDWLVKPLKPRLKTRLVGVIPHAVLNNLPFAAFTDGQVFFGDEHVLFNLPSVSILPFIRREPGTGPSTLLVMSQSQVKGLPFLQYGDSVARSIAQLYGTEPLIGGSATETAFRARAGNASIVLLAAHGKLNSRSPLFSQIILAPDQENNGILEIHEVYGLDLRNADLVVLSACQTQAGQYSQGDDIIGLNRAFLYAGTPTVVASLWSVAEQPTGDLMKAYFRHLKEGKLSKAEALQSAQREIRAAYPNPYYWAAFVLTGRP
jgi:CHAT domain-containing protein/Tfp pilus assembly protein PilF